MARHLLFSFVDQRFSTRTVPHEALSSKAVVILCKDAPFEGQASHAMFTHYPAFTRRGQPDAVSEIYWAYDCRCRPIMPGDGLPVCPNVFGEFVEDYKAFFDESRWR